MNKGRALAEAWNLAVKQALYSDFGNWYSKPKLFPSALIDKNGYLILNSELDLNQDGIKVKKQVNVRDGVSSLPGYVRITADFTDDLSHSKEGTFFEGAISKVIVNRYERDGAARRACIQHHGSACVCCKLDMGAKYGIELIGFIHVHHLIPISTIDSSYEVDPIHDLVPVCPNCHAAMHRFDPPLSIAQIRQRLNHSRNRKRGDAASESALKKT